METLVTLDCPWRMVPTTIPAKTKTATTIKTIFFALIDCFLSRASLLAGLRVLGTCDSSEDDTAMHAIVFRAISSLRAGTEGRAL